MQLGQVIDKRETDHLHFLKWNRMFPDTSIEASFYSLQKIIKALVSKIDWFKRYPRERPQGSPCLSLGYLSNHFIFHPDAMILFCSTKFD